MDGFVLFYSVLFVASLGGSGFFIIGYAGDPSKYNFLKAWGILIQMCVVLALLIVFWWEDDLMRYSTWAIIYVLIFLASWIYAVKKFMTSIS